MKFIKQFVLLRWQNWYVKSSPFWYFPSPQASLEKVNVSPGAMIPLVKNLEKACFNAKCVSFLAKIHHHCEIKKIGGKNTHLLGRVQIYEKVSSGDIVKSKCAWKVGSKWKWWSSILLLKLVKYIQNHYCSILEFGKNLWSWFLCFLFWVS